MKTKLASACLVMCLGLVAHAFAAMSDVKEPALGFPDSFPETAKAKVMAALRRTDCKFLGGTSFFSGTRLRYSGETISLNLFMESLAECPGITLSFRFHEQLGDPEVDWVLDSDGFEPQKLCVRINLKSSRIKLDALVVPDRIGPSLVGVK